jgi:fructose-6-phosphate aldolase, TalC/MipB family
MRLFIDSANMDEVRQAWEMGIISGVTTNPSLIAREGCSVRERACELATLVSGPVSTEVSAFSVSASDIIAEGREIASWHPNLVVKVPITSEGLKAVACLQGEGIRTNVTLVFTPSQALLAAQAGASFVSPFVGRLNDAGIPGAETVRDIVAMLGPFADTTSVIAASIRSPQDVEACALAGAPYATVPCAVFGAMLEHPLTARGIDRFKADWEGAFGKQA